MLRKCPKCDSNNALHIVDANEFDTDIILWRCFKCGIYLDSTIFNNKLRSDDNGLGLLDVTDTNFLLVYNWLKNDKYIKKLCDELDEIDTEINNVGF